MTLCQTLLAGAVSEDAAASTVARWLREARAAAARRGVSGGMLFDGQSWLQLFEGEYEDVAALVGLAGACGALGLDACLCEREHDGPRLSLHWACGYVEAAALEALREACVLLPDEAPAAFVAALASADAS